MATGGGGKHSGAGNNGQLRAIIERILRMKEDAREINGDIREIYLEAKGQGYDKTVLGQVVSYIEKRAKDPAAFAERSALFDLYLGEIGEAGTALATHTHEAVPVTAIEANHSGPYGGEPSEFVTTHSAAPSEALRQIDAGSVAEADAVQEPGSEGSGYLGREATVHGPAPDTRTDIQKTMDAVLARRPHCLHPTKCVTGDPRKHCWQCTKIHAEDQGFSA